MSEDDKQADFGFSVDRERYTLTRRQVASRLSIPLSTVRSLEKTNRLHPKKRAGRVLFDPVEVEQVALQRGRNPNAMPGKIPGRIAAQAYKLFDEGADLRRVVKELELAPELVDELYEGWKAPDLNQRLQARLSSVAEVRRRSREVFDLEQLERLSLRRGR